MSEAANTSAVPRPLRVLLFANTDWYLFNFRLALAKAARDEGVEVVLASPPGPYGSGRRFSLGFRANGAAQPQPDARGLCAMGSVASSVDEKNRTCALRPGSDGVVDTQDSGLGRQV